MMNLTNGAEIKRSEKANIVIYSKPGDGKTTVAGLLPGKTLMLSVDGTEQVLEGYSNVDVAKINPDDPQASLTEFYLYAKKNLKDYDNIFIDNITHYQKLWLLAKGNLTKSGMPELKDYALLDNHLLGVVQAFNDLPVNLVITCWETTRKIIHEDGQEYVQFVPDIREKIANHIMGVVHVVARLVKKVDNTRGFWLQGNQSVFAKNHLDSRIGCPQDELLNINKNNDEKALPSTENTTNESEEN